MNMLGGPELEFLGPSLGVFAIVLMRVLGLVFTAPQWGLAGVTARTRAILAIAIASAIAPGIAASKFAPVLPAEATAWIGLILVELSLGAAMGLSAALVVAGARQAGELVAQHAGLAPASLFDIEPARALGPIDLEEGATAGLTPLGHLHGMIALAVFLSLDGPLLMVRGLIQSFTSAPPGLGLYASHPSAPATQNAELFTRELFARVTTTLAQALRAAAPAGVALMLAGLALAWIARSGAGRPMSGLDWPVRVALGLVVASLSIATLATTLATFWTAWGTSIGGF